jgi:actin-like ATPase involved in cell morphogenesis
MDQRLASETGLHVAVAESPLTCVVLGAGAALDELESLKRAGSEARRGRGQRRFGRR